MKKEEFLSTLKKKLSGQPKQEAEERLNFYSEMIDDRVEEGRTEEEAILDIGSIDDISAQIIAEIPLKKIVKEKIKPKRRFRAWEIVLLIVGSPIWLSLAIAAFAVILSLNVSLWAVVISIWAVFASLVGCAIGGVVAGIVFIAVGSGFAGFSTIGAGFACAGLAIFLFFGCKGMTKGSIFLAKKFMLGIKKCFIKKENCDE